MGPGIIGSVLSKIIVWYRKGGLSLVFLLCFLFLLVYYIPSLVMVSVLAIVAGSITVISVIGVFSVVPFFDMLRGVLLKALKRRGVLSIICVVGVVMLN